MSKLDDIINNLCPNGVPFKFLGEVAQIGTGSSNGNEAEEGGDYPFFIRSQTVKFKGTYEYDEEAIIIPGEGGIGEIFHYINGKYALHQRVYRIHFTDKQINTRFVFYYMNAFFKLFILRKAVSATVTSIRKPMIESFLIPIPPLSVQEEIVRILDNFTELTAELTARKKQYEYYRDELLTFDDNEVEWKTLEQVALEFGRGKSRHRPRNDIRLYGGTIPFIQTGDIRNAPHIITEFAQTYTQFGLEQSKLWPKGTLCITIAANVAETAVLGFDSCFPDSVIGFVADPKKTSSSYVEYLLTSYKSVLQSKSTGSAQENINMSTFTSLLLPFPTLAEQEHIVSILDRFEDLASSITVGLPAEIKARQKQYEYYRDKLLTFKELS